MVDQEIFQIQAAINSLWKQFILNQQAALQALTSFLSPKTIQQYIVKQNSISQSILKKIQKSATSFLLNFRSQLKNRTLTHHISTSIPWTISLDDRSHCLITCNKNNNVFTINKSSGRIKIYISESWHQLGFNGSGLNPVSFFCRQESQLYILSSSKKQLNRIEGSFVQKVCINQISQLKQIQQASCMCLTDKELLVACQEGLLLFDLSLHFIQIIPLSFKILDLRAIDMAVKGETIYILSKEGVIWSFEKGSLQKVYSRQGIKRIGVQKNLIVFSIKNQLFGIRSSDQVLTIGQFQNIIDSFCCDQISIYICTSQTIHRLVQV